MNTLTIKINNVILHSLYITRLCEYCQGAGQCTESSLLQLFLDKKVRLVLKCSLLNTCTEWFLLDDQGCYFALVCSYTYLKIIKFYSCKVFKNFFYKMKRKTQLVIYFTKIY